MKDMLKKMIIGIKVLGVMSLFVFAPILYLLIPYKIIITFQDQQYLLGGGLLSLWLPMVIYCTGYLYDD